jgi:hypothetical protein
MLIHAWMLIAKKHTSIVQYWLLIFYYESIVFIIVLIFHTECYILLDQHF